MQECYTYNTSSWVSSFKLLEGLTNFAIVSSPYPNSTVFISGGQISGSNSNNSELLLSSGWTKSVPQIPLQLFGHCLVKINSTTVMLIAGSQSSGLSNLTYLLNVVSNVWVPGPSVQFARYGKIFIHICDYVCKVRKRTEP